MELGHSVDSMVQARIRQIIVCTAILGWSVGCAGSPLGQSVERSLEADPQLQDSAISEDTAAPEDPDPDAQSSDLASDNGSQAAIAPDTPDSTQTTAALVAPEPGEPEFIGPVWAPPTTRTASEGADGTARDRPPRSPQSTSLAGVPADLQDYIRDLQALDLITLQTSASNQASTDKPASESPFNQAVTRREYARWLFQAYNALYADEPGKRLRAGTSVDEPAFQDLPTSDSDFAAIQGLAEAGIIPSAFSGNSTAVKFNPDAPLSRADLILWKIPLDTRAALPQTSPEAITETWGFQDVSAIEPFALRAIAADFQLGDFSNIRRAFGYTTLLRPQKAATRAEAAAVIWRFGTQTDGRSAAEAQVSPEPAVSSDPS